MFFRCVCIWIGICAAIAAQGMQRDSSSRAIGLDERLSPVALFRTSLFDNPASQVYRYNTSLTQIGLSGVYNQQQEAVVMQQGRGNRFAAFDADSYVKQNGNTVWGSAGYRVGRTMHTVWNENADYELLYPYVWADSVGGNLNSERYTFTGGYGRQFGRVAWGIYADYRAEIEYRKTDPRPRNVVSDLNLSTGAMLALGGRYSVGLSADLQIYRQESSMRFFAVLGGPKMYQMLGLGMYSTRFSVGGDSQSLFFKGRGYGVGVNLLSRDGRGAFITVHYRNWAVRRILENYQNLPLTRLVDNELKGTVGWLEQHGRHHWGVKLSGFYAERTGTEYIYGDASGSENYPRLGAVEQYSNSRVEGKISAVWGFETVRGWSFYLEPSGGYYRFEAGYLNPQRDLTFDKMGAGLQASLFKKIRRSTLRLGGSADRMVNRAATMRLDGLEMTSSIGEMMQQNFDHLRADVTRCGVQLRWEYFFERTALAFYIQGDWQRGMYSDGNRSDYARIVCGVAF